MSGQITAIAGAQLSGEDLETAQVCNGLDAVLGPVSDTAAVWGLGNSIAIACLQRAHSKTQALQMFEEISRVARDVLEDNLEHGFAFCTCSGGNA